MPPLDLSRIAAAPEWLFDLAGESPAANSNVVPLPMGVVPDRPQRPPDAREAAYGRRVLDQECAELAGVTTGGRNAALNNAALAVATLFAAGVVEEGEARARLFAACEVNGLVREDGTAAVHATIASGFRRGRANPRGVPEPEPAGGVVPAPSPAEVDEAFNRVLWDDAASTDDQVEWVVKNTIPRRGVGIMAAQTTMAKSFCTLDLGGALATGQPWFDGRTRMRGGTLFLLGEAALTMRPRLKALREGKLANVPNTNPDTGEVLFTLDKLPIAFTEIAQLSVPAQLAKAEEVVRRTAEAMQSRFGVPLRLVVVDTAMAAFGFPEEPDQAAVQAAANNLKRLADACDGFGLVVHHHGKSSDTGSGRSGRGLVSQARAAHERSRNPHPEGVQRISYEAGPTGSHMWKSAFDMLFTITGKRRPTGEVIERRMRLDKNRYGAERDMGGFELAQIEVGRDEDGDPVMGAYIVTEAPAAERTSAAPAVSGQSSRASRVFLECVGGALASHGVEGCPYGPAGAPVRAVTVDEVRVLFRVAYAPGGRPEGHADAIRKAFNRSLETARLSGRLGFRETDGVAMIWETPGFMTTAERHALQGLDLHQTAA